MTIFGLKVLVVDDEIAIQRFLRVALNGQGFIVSEANTGQDALQALALNRPDLIILDLGLPDMDGVEVTRRAREWSTVPSSFCLFENKKWIKLQPLMQEQMTI